MFNVSKQSTFAAIGVGMCLIAGMPTSVSGVHTESGVVTGIAERDPAVTVFRGIPYAAPPVGDLRWRLPQPPSAWVQPRSCNKFGNKSLQNQKASEGFSEDCLYLNVWTTNVKQQDKQPVMVWIHGGGLTSGSGHQPIYNGTELAKRGVVVVTINYRLGALGFFSHPELARESAHDAVGNYGFHDQIAALKWVQNNIAGFGGDPDNVTVFGESAGGTSVYCLIASPLAKGLFDKAILQSAWLDPQIFHDVASANERGVDAATQILEGRTDDQVAALRAMPADELANRFSKRGWTVTIDGWFLPQDPRVIFRDGIQNLVPMLAGTNRDEGTMFTGRQPYPTVQAYEAEMRERYRDHADQMLEVYSAQSTKDIRKAVVQRITDSWFIQPTREFLRHHSAAGATAFQYHFTRTSPSWPWLGAAHAAELGFVFNTLEKENLKTADRQLAEAMIQLWTAFAKSGVPSADSLPEWPPYATADDQHMVLDADFKVDSGLRRKASDMIDAMLESTQLVTQ